MADETTSTDGLGANPVAIVGLGALYPRSPDVREYWRNIVDGVDCIEDVPETHWRIEDYYDPDPSTPDKTYVRRGGFLPTVDFNPLEYGLPPNTIEVTDVLQLLSLMVAKQTLHDAGVLDKAGGWPARTGVVLGVTGANSLTQPLATRLQTPVLKDVVRSYGLSDVDAEEIADRFRAAFAPWEENSFPGMLGNVVAGRIANRFDLGGMNCTVDAACASSLAAVRMAVSELVSGRADLMLTGGCDAENTILMYLCFSKTPAFSRTEVIRPFDANSDGTLIGEGLGMLALKRLADAERDGDRIYAVLRGIGSSSDGRFKSIYAPRKEGQVTALRRAYADAGFGPEQVGLVECHGTGTAVGDLTELTALGELYADADRGQVCVGSVKSQIGHTKAAAGAAGLIKMALALHDRVLPPTINVREPARAFDESPFHLSGKARPWIADPDRPVRRAAVSSFGFGGTNFHCVLEEYPAAADRPVFAPAAEVRMWSGENVAALITAMERDPDGVEPTGDTPSGHARVAVVGGTAEELAEARELALDRLRKDPDASAFSLRGKDIWYRSEAVPEAKVAALFAGQGSQYVGMGARAAICVPHVRAAFDQAATAFGGVEALGRVIFPSDAFDDATRQAQEEALRRTDHAQPAIGALAAGQYRYLAELGLRPEAGLGHSFGELTALWAAGSLSDQELVALARVRGQAMAATPTDGDPGAMAAVRGTCEDVQQLLADRDGLWICNVNAPGQTVVGGGTAAVEQLVADCAARGIHARRLPVAAAFHTPHVAHAVPAFRTAVDGVSLGAPQFSVLANTPGAEYGDDPVANREVLTNQLVNPVHFGPRVEQLYRDGCRIFVEFGPKAVLSGLVRDVLRGHDDVAVVATDAGPDRDGDRSLKQAVAQLVVLGVPLAGCHRFRAVDAPMPTRKGMTIPLNGVNHVSEQRREAYRQALAQGAPATGNGSGNGSMNGTAPHSGNGAAQYPANGVAPHTGNGVAAYTGNGVEPHSGNGHHTPAAAADRPDTFPGGMLAVEHLAMHRDYLAGQTGIAERLSRLLENESTRSAMRDEVITGISALAQHNVAIAHSHAQASEVVRGFAQLAGGIAPPANGFHVPATRMPELAPPPREPAALTAAQPAIAVPPPAPVEDFAPAPTPPAPVQSAPVQPVPVDSGPAMAAPAQPESAAGQDVSTALLRVVSEKTGYPVDMLETSMDMEADLGIDSIKRIEIMGGVQQLFPDAPAPEPERLAELRTLDDVIGFIGGEVAAPKS
ncbi:type I polyketide synthase [Kutzneria sp. CA-103260]|uniref:type I polyketide synthase n=1 Tax=Kutzneria sp. CA-103260 TaxID=2802641 RepID=UPI001BAD386B|nr:type I polyketide synthase [Kutzneria sp. CA-103260]QUQ72489.1 hypothetical protein JJ691_102780 [Kutzneria sp. CA-103260]